MAAKKPKKQPAKKPAKVKPKAAKPKKKAPARKPVKKPVVQKPVKKPTPKKPVKTQPTPAKDATAEQIEKLSQAGQLAKYKLYQGFITRISKGETLKATELKIYNQLSMELFSDEEDSNGKDAIIAGEMEAVAYLGISKRMLSYHKKRGNITQNADGTYSRAVLDEFLAERGGSDPLDTKIKKAKLRVIIAKAQLQEMLVRQSKGELAAWKEIEAEWSARVALVTSGLETLGDRLPPLLEGKTRQQMKDIIKNEVWQFRNGFAVEGKYC